MLKGKEKIISKDDAFDHVRSISQWAKDNSAWHIYADHIARRNTLSVSQWGILHDGFVAGYRAGTTSKGGSQ